MNCKTTMFVAIWLVSPIPLIQFDVVRAEEVQEQATSDHAPGSLGFFETQIRPVLVEQCYACHSAKAKIVRGGLWLDSREAIRRGGDSGPTVIPGDVENSLIVSALQHKSFEMPPDKKLGDLVVKRFSEWIEAGAIDPRSETDGGKSSRIDPVAAREHWAFQPVQRPKVPIVQDAELSRWIRGPIDAFIASQLANKGWRPAGEADKYTLIRRATFDLIGLPPTPEEISAFVNDASADSFARVVDRLLDSHHYGERWGRHWLDLVRYADTNGADENHKLPNAWRYRDWVIRALNRDQPLDEFVVHQLAGDLLIDTADEDMHGELLTATGMLVLGPKMLAEQDKEKMLIDIVDEQIDTVSRTMLGMTLACARCHDHKFDPITAEDYYSLAGIFASTRTMLHQDHVSQWMERDLPSATISEQRRLHESKLADARGRLQQLTDQANGDLLSVLGTTELPDNPMNQYPAETKAMIAEATKAMEAVEMTMPQFDSVMAVTESQPVALAVHIRGNHLQKAEHPTARGVPLRIAEATPFSAIPAEASGRLELARWLTSPDHVLTGRVMTNRLWMWHFGQSLVESPSNFGLQCPRPLHKELLDWLTREFVDHGWSLKRMHRLIMLSSTYRMTSRDSNYVNEDPSNQFWWRQNRRRLELEPLRDSILAVGNSLDHRLGGPSEGIDSIRRTVYLSVNRAALFDLFSTFDYIEPANHIEQRSVSTVPSQALFLMNHSIVHEQAQRLAAEVLEMESDDRVRLENVWMTVLGRPPVEVEKAMALDFLAHSDESEKRQSAWASLCRTLIAGSMFSYVE